MQLHTKAIETTETNDMCGIVIETEAMEADGIVKVAKDIAASDMTRTGREIGRVEESGMRRAIEALKGADVKVMVQVAVKMMGFALCMLPKVYHPPIWDTLKKLPALRWNRFLKKMTRANPKRANLKKVGPKKANLRLADFYLR